MRCDRLITVLLLGFLSTSMYFAFAYGDNTKTTKDDYDYDMKPQYLPKEKATFVNDGGELIPMEVEVLRRREELEKGMMFRKDLAPNAAMLFIFPQKKRHAFWMKNTPIALDIVLLDCQGYIVDVIYNARPFEEKVLHSDADSCAALEMPAGSLQNKGLHDGNRFSHAIFPLTLQSANPFSN